MTMRHEIIAPVALVVYFAAVVVTYGHFVGRSDFCGHDKNMCHTDRVMMGFFPALAWPLYWSTKAWEK